MPFRRRKKPFGDIHEEADHSGKPARHHRTYRTWFQHFLTIVGFLTLVYLCMRYLIIPLLVLLQSLLGG